ncbi:hypothetical protein AAHB59_13400 [Bacillus cereus]
MEEHNETITSSDYIAVGRVEKVIDGDTIDVKLLKVSNFLSNHLKTEQIVTVRYNGVETPETLQSGWNPAKTLKILS